MFKITLNEAFLLVEANKRLKGESWYLCAALRKVHKYYKNEQRSVMSLLSKIKSSLNGHTFLSERMASELKSFNWSVMSSKKLRKVWIKKLLAYNGY